MQGSDIGPAKEGVFTEGKYVGIRGRLKWEEALSLMSNV